MLTVYQIDIDMVLTPENGLVGHDHAAERQRAAALGRGQPALAVALSRTCKLRAKSLANTNCCSRRHNRISALVGVANY